MRPTSRPIVILVLVSSLLSCRGAALAGPAHGTDAAPVPPPKLAGPRYVKPSSDELRRRLTPLSFYVTQQSGTERPFANAFWKEKRRGIYVDVVSGEPLFSSRDKFDSGTGWPSFTRPVAPGNVVERKDRSHAIVRVEVRSKYADSHLGHVFDDGPRPTGLRYCINSAALRFVPVSELAKQGYQRYVPLFSTLR